MSNTFSIDKEAQENIMSDRLLDNISRILASPMPRRSMVKLMAGGFGAAAAAIIGSREARAACKPIETVCGDICCKKGEICFVSTKGLKSCRPAAPGNWSFAASAGSAAAAGGAVYGAVAGSQGCKKNEVVCGQTCCPPGHACTSPGTCCPPGHVCGNLCCPTGQSCVVQNGQYRCEPVHPSASK
jgi:hypothetical protein